MINFISLFKVDDENLHLNLRLYTMDLTGSCYDDQHLAKTIFAYDLLHGYNANGYDFNFD